jgi:hypothetical protein
MTVKTLYYIILHSWVLFTLKTKQTCKNVSKTDRLVLLGTPRWAKLSRQFCLEFEVSKTDRSVLLRVRCDCEQNLPVSFAQSSRWAKLTAQFCLECDCEQNWLLSFARSSIVSKTDRSVLLGVRGEQNWPLSVVGNSEVSFAWSSSKTDWLEWLSQTDRLIFLTTTYMLCRKITYYFKLFLCHAVWLSLCMRWLYIILCKNIIVT